VSTWEQKMSERAAARKRIEDERQRVEQDHEWEAEQADLKARLAVEQRAEFESGPPDGCRECWTWGWCYFGIDWRFSWIHGDAAVPGPPPADVTWESPPEHWCHHACHGSEPVFCGPIAFAAAG
jgi:hypothetical protein